MKRGLKKWLLLLPVVALLLTAAVLIWMEQKKTPVPNNIAAKAAAFLLTDQESIDNSDLSGWVSDGEATAWYTRYFCWLYDNEVFDPQSVPLEEAGQPLTYKTFLHFLDQVGCRDLVSDPLGQLLPFLKVPETCGGTHTMPFCCGRRRAGRIAG